MMMHHVLVVFFASITLVNQQEVAGAHSIAAVGSPPILRSIAAA